MTTTTQGASAELLPCPFCGGAARFERVANWHDLVVDHVEDCFLSGDAAEMSYLDSPGVRERMAFKWNTRAAQPAAPVDYTVDDSELARKIMVFLGQRTSGSMEPGADPLRDRLAERIALWRPAASPQVEVAPQAEQVASRYVLAEHEVGGIIGWWNSQSNSRYELCRAVEVAVIARCRAQGGNTERTAGAGLEEKSCETRMDTGFDAGAGFISTERAAAPADAQEALDAARYRWLRHADLDALAVGNWGTGQVYEGVKFDDAIDRAMAANQAIATRTAEGADKRDAEGGAA